MRNRADPETEPSGWPPTTWWPACSWFTACTRTTCTAGCPTRWTGCGRTWVRTAATSICSRSPTDDDRAAGVHGQLQELPVVGGDAGAGRRGRGSGCGAGDLVDRGGRPPSPRRGHGVIPAESLLAHVHSNGRSHSNGATTWHPVPELAELAPGEVAGSVIAGTTMLACRVGDQPFAYRDHCPVCDDSLAGAQLHGTLLRCPRCGTRISTSCTRVPACRRREPTSTRSRCCSRRGAVGGTAARSRLGAARHDEPRYDGAQAASASATGRPPSRPASDAKCAPSHRRRASARGECGWPAADVRVPRLLSAVHRHRRRTALPRGAGPVSGVSGFRAGPPRLGGTADPGRRRLLLHQLRARRAPSPSTPARPGPANPSSTWTPGTPSAAADSRVGLLADDVEALLVRVPETTVRDGESGQPQSYLVPIDACYEFVGRLRMLWRGFDGGQEARQFIDEFFSQIDGPRLENTARDAAMTGQHGRELRHSRRGARTVHRQPGADRPRRRRRRAATTPCTPSRCAARSASSRCDGPTPTTKRPG